MSDKGLIEGKGKVAYFVLRVVPTGVQVGIGRAGKLLSLSKFVTWDVDKGDDGMVRQVDEAIAQAVEGLAEDVPEPGEVLYGVPASWVHEHQLLPTHKQRLKGIASRLELKPMGFVVTSEALVRYLSGKEKFPINGLLIEVGEQMLEVDWIRSGQVWESRAKKREGDEVEDLAGLLGELPSTMGLPPKWWVFDAKERVGELVGRITEFNWGEKSNLKLDHLPEVEAIGKDECLEAVCGVVATSSGAGIEDKKKPGERKSNARGVGVAGGGVGKAEPFAEKKEDGQVSEKLGSIEEVGFVWGKDSEKLKVQPVRQAQDGREKLQVKSEKEIQVGGLEKGNGEDVKQETVQDVGVRGKVELGGVGGKRGLGLKIPKKLLLVPLILVLGLGLLGFGYWYFPSAEVTLAVKPTRLEEKISLKIDPSAEELDFESGVIPGRVLEVEMSIERTGGVSGEKTIGDQAKGRVKIFNDTSSVQLLEVGTELASAAGLKFSLDEEVKVASKSVDPQATPPFKPGEAEVGVTAVEIGADYNLASGASFSVANFAQSSLIGRGIDEFTGGSARQVKAVSEEDREGLLGDARGSLLEEGGTELRGQVSGESEELIEESIQLSGLVSEFNHEVGDEAEELHLNLSGKIEGVVFSKGSFDEWVRGVVESRVPEGMALLGEKEVAFEGAMVEGEGGVGYEVSIGADLVPEIDTEEIRSRVRGRTPEAVRGYLSSLSGSPEVRLVFRPALPDALVRFPFRVERISIELEERE
jgi:hypothetical protein